MKWDVEVRGANEFSNSNGLKSITSYTRKDTAITMGLWQTHPCRYVINVRCGLNYPNGIGWLEPCGEFEYNMTNLRKMSWYLENAENITAEGLKQFIKSELT